MNDLFQKDNVWALLGKAFVAMIGVGAGFLAFYTFYTQKEEKIIASGLYSPFVFPKKIEPVLFGYKGSPSSSELLDIMRPTASKDSGMAILDTRDQIIKYFENYNKDIDANLEKMKNVGSFMQVIVRNSGTRQSENTSIELAGNGYFEIADRKPEDFQEFDKSISLGTLAPTSEVKVNIWLKSSIFYKPDKALVTYANGAIPIEFKQFSTYEPPTTFWSIMNTLAYMISAVTIFSIASFYIDNFIKSKIQKTETTSDSTIESSESNSEETETKNQ